MTYRRVKWRSVYVVESILKKTSYFKELFVGVVIGKIIGNQARNIKIKSLKFGLVEKGDEVMEVLCDEKICKWNRDEKCIAELININDLECGAFEQLPEEILFPDVFYAHIEEKYRDEENPEWKKTRGKKIILLDREMFNRNGFITDGRTGAKVCHEERIEKFIADKEKVLERLIKCEKDHGVSPLYEQEAANEGV